MKDLQIKIWQFIALLAAALISSSSVHAGTPASWKESGFSINANGMKLRDVLNEFGQTYGVRVSIQVKDQAVLKGRLKADGGGEFLDRLAQTYDFSWFVYSGTLYIVPRNENVSLRLEIGEDAVQDAKSALMGVGLFDNRFGWGELPDEGVVIVNGPREYVNLAREVLLPETKKQTYHGRQVMVFRLKYASATDRVINTRGQKETIPGIKTILSGLLNSEGADTTGNSRNKFDAASEKRSRSGKNGKGNAYEGGIFSRSADSRGKNEEEDADVSERSGKQGAPAREDRPRIDADASLNAIIIYDYVNKREMYQSLISELDIEPQQIEIEALIVDIDRTKLADLGVEWSVRSGNVVTTVNSTQADSAGVDLPIPGSTMLISNAARFYARLKALEGSGEARILAKPTVLTLDNVAAVLDLNQTAYVPLVGERVADLANVTAGTMLRVVPRVVHEGQGTRVRLEVDIEDGSLGDPSLKSGVTRSTISTQAIIDLQQTLMIGGYHSESTSKNQQKVPVLGDVPLFGGLFRSTTENISDKERLFLITPRLAGSSGVPAPARSTPDRKAREIAEADYAQLMERSRNRKALPPSSTTPVSPAAPATPVSPVTSAGIINAGAPVQQNMSPGAIATSEQTVPAIPRKLKCSKPKIGFDLGSLGAGSRMP